MSKSMPSIFLTVGAITCICGGVIGLIPGGAFGLEKEPAKPTPPEEKLVMTAAGAKFQVPLAKRDREAAARALREGALEVLHLRITGIELPKNHALIRGVQIFANNPKADAKTSIKDASYAGSFALGLQKHQNMVFDVAPVLQRLQRDGQAVNLEQPLLVTLVVVPGKSASPKEDLAIPFRRLTLELPSKTDEGSQTTPRMP
jgi:hypothetical protein